MNLKISPAALQDLKGIKEYISGELSNPAAAERTVRKIIKAYMRLADSPYIGTSLNAIIDIESEYRYLVSGNYLVFYKVFDNEVHVERVIYGRRDYLHLLFGKCFNEDE